MYLRQEECGRVVTGENKGVWEEEDSLRKYGVNNF